MTIGVPWIRKIRSVGVPPGRKPAAIALVLILAIAILLVSPGTSSASFIYSIPKQQDQLTIKEDGSVTLVRYFEFRVESTSTDSGTEVWAGLPTPGTKVSSVVDQDGRNVRFSTRSSGGEYVVALSGFTIKPGTSRAFTITAAIPGFIHRDAQNAGYVTMQYSPGWWTSTVAVQDIAVVLPAKVEKSEIKTGARKWDGIAQTTSGAYVVTWQFRDLRANERVSVNVGIPEKYVALPAQEKAPVSPPTGLPSARTGRDWAVLTGILAAVMAALAGGAVLSARSRREDYASPQVSMEGVGVNETLSPVEASVLLRQPPEKSLTLLLFSLVKDGVVRVYGEDPLRVQVQSDQSLTEAQRLFVAAIDRSSGEIDGAKLIPCLKYLTASVNEKMRPYCRRDTEAFYRGVIQRMWDEVSAADSPEVKLSALDKDFLWLVQDEDRMKDAENQFPRDRTVGALPDWWMLGFMFNRPYGYPYYMWPGALWGRYSGIYGGLVGERERESMRAIEEEVWTPAQAPARGIFRGRGGSSTYRGGFTPPSCACACACVSCACACACAGGGGCT